MDYKMSSATGSKPRSIPARYRPEVILSLGFNKDLDSYRPKDKMEFIDNYKKTFDHNQFYADLTNDLRINQGLTMMKIRKGFDVKDSESFLNLYLKIDKDENDFTAELKNELQDIQLENKGKKAKKDQRPQLTPKPGMDEDDEMKKKEEYKFSPPKLRA